MLQHPDKDTCVFHVRWWMFPAYKVFRYQQEAGLEVLPPSARKAKSLDEVNVKRKANRNKCFSFRLVNESLMIDFRGAGLIFSFFFIKKKGKTAATMQWLITNTINKVAIRPLHSP